jgi:flagellar hook assembly protein FlgD
MDRVKLVIYDLLGRQIRTLFDRIVTQGNHPVKWDGLDDNGNKAGAGVYFYRLKTESGFTKTQKMILLN